MKATPVNLFKRNANCVEKAKLKKCNKKNNNLTKEWMKEKKCNAKKEKSVLRLKTIRIGNLVASVFQFLAFGMSRKVRQRREEVEEKRFSAHKNCQ